MAFKPLSIFIGLRYTRAKRQNRFISFISLVSMLGIALGVAVLITVLSVMNGFDKEIQNRVFSMIPAITVSSTTGAIINGKQLQHDLQQFPEVINTALFVSTEVLLSSERGTKPALLNGILPEAESKMSVLPEKMQVGKLTDLQPKRFGIVLGEELAANLNVEVGSVVTVMTPQAVVSPAGIIPRSKRFHVVGLFRAGSGFGFDRGLGFIHLEDAQRLMSMGTTVTGIQVKIHDPYKAPQLTQRIMQDFAPNISVSNWADTFGPLFYALKLEKNMMFFILLLIVAVAAFNLVSTLMMVVNEKEADIAILRTFGATPSMILRIFLMQGSIVGVLGTLLGVFLGLSLAYNVTGIVQFIEHLFHVQFLSSSAYFLDYLPSDIQLRDVLTIALSSFLLSLLATLYPAWRASRLNPVESLRYE